MSTVNVYIRGMLVATVAAGLTLALPAVASATVYCVNEPACVGEKEGKDGAALQKALEAAGEHPDSSVVIGPGSYSHKKGFRYTGSEPITIRGAGAGATVLTSPIEKDVAVFTLSSSGSTLSGVSVEIPKGEGQVGISLGAGTVENVSVSGGGGPDVPTGLSISGGVFTRGSIEMDEATTSTGVEFEGGGEVLASTITADYGTQGDIAEILRGCRISAAEYGVLGYFADLTVEDTLIDLRGGNGQGVGVVGNASGNAQGTLRGLSIVNGSASSIGVYAEGNHGASSTVALESSVIADLGHPIVERTEGADSKASTATDYSSYEATADEELNEPPAVVPAAPIDENPVAGGPDFVAPVLGEHGFGEGDWHLAPSSPLIDAGKPGGLAAGEYAFDVEGNPRIVNGRRDVGAYEYQRRAPVVGAGASTTTATVGQAITFSGSATEPEPGDTISGYRWTFDDGASVPAGASATHAFSAAGTHTATLTATDALGIASTATVTVTVTAAAKPLTPLVRPKVTDPLGRGKSLLGGLTASLSALHVTPRAFKAAHSGSSVTRKSHTGTRVSFTMSAAGTVDFSVERLAAGFTQGHRCVAARHSRNARRCTRHVKLPGVFSVQASAGANSFRFSGRLEGHALARGSYRLAARVEDLASLLLTSHAKKAKPLSAAFRIG